MGVEGVVSGHVLDGGETAEVLLGVGVSAEGRRERLEGSLGSLVVGEVGDDGEVNEEMVSGEHGAPGESEGSEVEDVELDVDADEDADPTEPTEKEGGVGPVFGRPWREEEGHGAALGAP